VETSLRPYFRKRFLLSKPEKYFYNILREVFTNHTILAKVRLADLVEANRLHPSWRANFNRICSKHIDFVICDAWLSPLLAVELDGSSHKRVDRQHRDELVDRILRDASLEIVHVRRQNRYFHQEVRKLLLPILAPTQLL
jgi:very-short-patch-repair endonuclease